MENVKKESLVKLLTLIDEICINDENIWFKEQLMRNLIATSKLVGDNSDNLLNNIEKYLKLDGYKIIDYSAIKNEKVRNQLFRDCIEMSKYRLGKINDTISFDEFCRYAHLQVEELLNHFYYERFKGDIIETNNFIKKHWPQYIEPNSNNISSISIHAKTIGFINECGFNNTTLSRTLDFLRELRNESSHRNSYQVKNEDSILSTLAVKQINVKSSYIDFNTTSPNDRKLFEAGRYIYLKRNQDYFEIIENLEILKEAIIILL